MAGPAKDTSFKAETEALDATALTKDLFFTALITLALLVPIVSYKTIMNQGSLILGTRWGLVLALTAITVIARLLLHLFVWNRAPKPKQTLSAGQLSVVQSIWLLLFGSLALIFFSLKFFPSLSHFGSIPGAVFLALLTIFFFFYWISPIFRDAFARSFNGTLLIVAIAVPLVLYVLGNKNGLNYYPGWDKRGIDFAITIMIYIMLGWGLNIVVGLAGLLDLGYVAFYAVGAYAYALLTTIYLPQWFGEGVVPWAFYIVLPIAGLLAALWGVILGFPVLRLRGDYLAIVTLAFGEIIRLVLINWFSFTQGPQGINVPKATFFGLPFTSGPGGFADFFGLPPDRIYSYMFLYYVALALALLVYFATNRLRRLPIGRAWEALREDEIACRSLGINTTTTKLTAFSIGAMFGGFAGSFFAARQGFVSPESFVYIESALILAIVVLGGLGSQIGIVFSALAIVGSFEVFRELGFLTAILPEGVEPVQFRMLAVGLAMVLMMRWRPRGLVTRRDPTVFLKEKKSVSADLVSQGHG
jgi:branched-chain amino acid transport system permease protein